LQQFYPNAVVAFIASAFACFLVYNGFNAISRIPAFQSGADYYIEMLGIDFHYRISAEVLLIAGILFIFLA
jgi:ABC-2 type transport system permease protein